MPSFSERVAALKNEVKSLAQRSARANKIKADVFVKSRAIFNGSQWPIDGGGNEYSGKLKLMHSGGGDEMSVVMRTDGRGGITSLDVRERTKGATVENQATDALTQMLIDRGWE